MMSPMSVASAPSGNHRCAAGIIAIPAGMVIAAVRAIIVTMSSRLRTARHRTHCYHTAGTVAISTAMVIATVSLLIMAVIARLCTSFYHTDCNRPAGTVTISAAVVIAAVGLLIMTMVTGLRTASFRAHRNRSAGTVAVSARMSKSAVSHIVMDMQSRSHAILYRTYLAHSVCLHINFHICLSVMMSMSGNRHYKRQGQNNARHSQCCYSFHTHDKTSIAVQTIHTLL